MGCKPLFWVCLLLLLFQCETLDINFANDKQLLISEVEFQDFGVDIQVEILGL